MTLGMLLLALMPVAAANAAEDHRQVMRKAAELLIQADGNLDKLFFTRRRETRELDAAGAVTSKGAITVRREPYEELVIMRTIAKNDQPLSPQEIQVQEESIRKGVAQYRQRGIERRLCGYSLPAPESPGGKGAGRFWRLCA